MVNDRKLVLYTQFGSHLYGTNTPQSDLDFKGIFLPTEQEILLQKTPNSITNHRSKEVGEKNVAGEIDYEIYSFQYYLKLLAEGQTVALDMLFANEKNIIQSNNLWKLIQEEKANFLSKRSTAFVGYCRTQANKYGIKGSRVAAAKQAMEFFSKAIDLYGTTVKVEYLDYMLPESEHASIVIGTDGIKYYNCCNRKVPFTANVKLAHEIYSRIYEEYGKRARLAESNDGVDWKALSHAVRVGQEALELLNTGKITLPLRNAKHILAIKQGTYPYKLVAEEIEQLLVEVEEAAKTSTLPETPNYKAIDELVEHVHLGVIKGIW